MKKLIQLSLWLWFVSSAAAQQELREYDWKNLQQQHALLDGEVVMVDGAAVLKIENTNDEPVRFQLLKITNPPVASLTYAVAGQVKYEKVQGDGYLEMWNVFAPLKPGAAEAQYFSRTLGDAGEMRKITGTSDWRKLLLPFNRAGTARPPARLEINLFLPGRGTVYLRPMKLTGTVSGWWSAKQGGLIGGAVGIFGGIIGCFGGLLGCLAGFGKARKFVLTTTKIFIALGMLLTITGIVAIAYRQPFFVWYVFLLPGVGLTLIFSLNFPMIRRRYDDLEIRRMASIDAMGS
jgi:hypothetical protein